MTSVSRTKPKCLIVEDDEDCRWIVMRSLMKLEFDCEVAKDGVQALQILAHDECHVVVTDLKMPNKHGFSLAAEIKQGSNPPAVVVYTGVEEPKLVTQLYALGVDDVCIKPISPDVLAAKIKAVYLRWLESRRGAGKAEGPELQAGAPSAAASGQQRSPTTASSGGSASSRRPARRIVKLAAGAG